MKTIKLGRTARLIAVATVAAAVSGLHAGQARAAQAGTNFCVNQGHIIYQSATFSSGHAGFVSFYGVWHHYSTHGNWSLGYERGTGEAGYVPLGILAQDLGNSSTATACPYH